jgi:hypothetical protein
MLSPNPVGTVGGGLFLLAISVFVSSMFDPFFGPVATGCIAAGGLAAALLVRRRPHPPHIDPRLVDTSDVSPKPIEPR